MNVLINKLNYFSNNQADIIKSHSAVSDSKKLSKNFDEISIRSNSAQTSEKSFMDTLTRRISSDIHQSASSQKLIDMRDQIETGTYQIDIDKIIEKIMLS